MDKRIGTKVPEFADIDKIPGAKRDTGTYIGIVKNNVDPGRSGRLQVFIPDFGGVEDNKSHWITVSYANPYMGAARRPQIATEKSQDNDYDKVNHAYGMWFTPPDIGNYVLVTFVSGNTNVGYWFACIMPDTSHWAIPAQAGALKLETPKDPKLTEVLTTPPYPVVEFNEENGELKKKRSNFLDSNKPIHENQVKILLKQGLEDDKVRGVISSSSQRESPSHVFGISTPGVDSPEKDSLSGSPYYRLGGHSFVMDDGDKDGKDKLVRLRSAGGHQILMSDSENVIYIANSTGTAWMEFTSDGKIHVYSQSDFNLRSSGSINMHSDKSINMFAHDDVKIFAGANMQLQSDTMSLKAITDLNVFGGTMEVSAGSTLAIQAGTQGSWGTGGDLVCSSGGKIYLNDRAATRVTPVENMPIIEHKDTVPTKPAPYFKWKNTGKVSSTISLDAPIPTHEPFASQHIPGTGVGGVISTTPNSSKPVTTEAKTPTSNVVDGSGNPVLDGSGNPVQTGTSTSPIPPEVIGSGVSKPASPADLANQPPNSTGVGTLSAGETTALKAQIGKSESGGNYAAENQLGYIGKYQMGAAALADQGYVAKGTTNSQLSDPSVWTGKNGLTSKEAFLSTPDLQEKIMDKNLSNNYNALKSKGTIDSNSSSDDVGGKLAVAHLLGAGGTNKWANGGGGADANGTTGDTYYNRGRYAVTVLAGTGTTTTASAPVQVATVKGGVITG